MTNHSVLFRIFLLSLTFLGALCSHLTLMPDSPEIVKQVGAGFVVTCMSLAPNKPTVHWKSNKGIISTHHLDGVHVQQKQFGNSTGLSLIFLSIEPSDAGMYFCEDSHDAGKHLFFKLTIYEQMTFKDTTLEQSFKNGETAVTIRCEASGNPTPVIKWSGKEGILTQPKYQPVADGLVIRNVTPDDAGLYTCLAIQAGNDEFVTADIRVNVLYKPQWNSTAVPDVLFRVKDEKAALSCSAHAYPTPVFRWFFRGTRLESNASDVFVHDDGIYRCEVDNGQGAIARNFTVLEGHLPGRPDLPQFKNSTVNTVTLDFTPPKPTKHHNITGYNIELRDKNSSHQKHVKLSDGPPFVIKDLRPGTTYVVRLKAENELGFGDYSIEFEAKTSKASFLCTFPFFLFFLQAVSFGYLF